MTILQLLGLRCRHRNRSQVYCGVRTCLDCGERVEFTNYQLTEQDRRSVGHYIVQDRSINRITPRLRLKRRA